MHTADMEGLDPFQLKPSVDSRPGEQVRESSVIPLYQKAEARIFNLIASDFGGGVAPYRYVDVTSGDGQIVGTKDARTAAWSALYLYSVITEDRRPEVWVTRATAKFRELCDWLLTQQCGSPTQDSAITALLGAATAATDLEYGGFIRDQTAGDIYSEDVGAGGLALLYAFKLFGEEKYRAGYRAALTCLRRMQCTGKLATGYSVRYPGDTGRYHPGMWTHTLQVVF
jgi:hypothetical protein